MRQAWETLSQPARIKLEAVALRPAADAAERIERLQRVDAPIRHTNHVTAGVEQVDLDQVALPRKRLLLFRLVRRTSGAGGLVCRTHHLDQRDELHRVVRVEDLDPRLVNLKVLDLHDHRRIGPGAGCGGEPIGTGDF